MNDADMRLYKHLLEKVIRIEAKLDELLAKKNRVVKPRGSKLDLDADFEAMWAIYPKRAGSNPKKKAYSAWKKRLEEDGFAWHHMDEGAKRYLLFCRATDILGTSYVQQAATFFGPDKHYENDWTIPKDKTQKPEHISATYKQYDPSAPTDKHLTPSDRFGDV